MKETGLLGFFTAVGITCFTVGGIVLTANHTFAPHYALKDLGKKVDDNFVVLEKKLVASDLKMERVKEEMNAIRTELALTKQKLQMFEDKTNKSRWLCCLAIIYLAYLAEWL
jgi:hypothetical protein